MKKGFKIFLFICIVIYLYINLSFSAYNIRPVKECSKFLKRTYGREFRRTREPVSYYMEDGYHIWKIQYVDDAGMEFYEYYEQPYETVEDGYYPCFVRDERFVIDYYWQQQLQRVYGEMFDLEQHRWREPSTVKYEFEITDENDIGEAAKIISVLMKYTFDNNEAISPSMLGYLVTYDGLTIYRICTTWKMEDNVLELQDWDEKDIYQYIYDEIHRCYQKRIEKQENGTVN